ncbi:sugar transferase [Solihabitans fulvus]|uniref:sugar transferase n=1 Tax=Solihabitans fulvus TaxID=1892852 RepID=UPI0016620550
MTVLAAVGVPVGCIAGIPALRDHPPLTVALTLAYEFGVLLVGFAAAVVTQLRSRWSARAADAFDGAVQRLLSPYTRYYLRYVAAETRYVDLKGVTTKAEFTLEMKDIYVRLALDTDPAVRPSTNPVGYGPSRTTNGADIWEWLRDGGREIGSVIAILAPPGRGKTTLLRHIAFVTASNARTAARLRAPRKIPVIVYLRDHRDWTFSTPRDLVDLIERTLPSIGGRPRPPQWVEKNLRRGRFLLLVDGLDEIADPATRRAMASWLETQASAQTDNLLMITSRPFGYRDNEITGATVLRVQAFSPDQIDAFITQWYSATSIRSYGGDNASSRIAAARGAAELSSRLDQTRALHDLASNPLLLTMIATVHHYRDALPGSRAELYREICEVFLGKRHEARGIALDMPAARKKMVLQELAYAMMRLGVRDISTADAAELVRPALTRVTVRVSPVDFLRRVEESSGLLLERERDLLTFAHLTLQEFLAAEHIRENNLGHELIEAVQQDWWHETALLYAANADATDLVVAFLRADGGREAELLALAVQCVEEARELSPEARSVVEQRLNPPDLRANPASRRNAARARLLLRAARERRVSRGVYTGPPVTWLEYQHLLDSVDDCRIPDHWVDSVFPAGAEDEPAAGMRHEDARAFCAWLTAELESEHTFRLPSTSELDDILAEAAAPEAYWSTDAFDVHGDTIASRLFRTYSERRQRVPYPRTNYEPWRADLAKIAKDDAAQLFRLADGSPPFLEVPGGGRLDRAVLGHAALVARTLAPGPLPSSCDLQQIMGTVADVAAVANEYAGVIVPGDPAEDASRELTRIGADLARTARHVFDRTRYRSRRDPGPRQDRGTVRIMVLAMSTMARVLYLRLGGESVVDPAGIQGRLDPSREDDRRLIGVIAMSLLEDYLHALYRQLVLHEARTLGATPPAESLRYVRLSQTEPDTTAAWTGVPRDLVIPLWHRLKPVVDRLAAFVLLLVLAPLLFVVAVAVMVDTRGSAFYVQRRCGRHGTIFPLVKFRSMVVNADELTIRLTDRNEGSGLLFKMRRDPRVTRVGGFLRRYSVDELPQLFNVLAGHMSIVGPRPPLPEELGHYDQRAARRLLLKPGITGLWQVSGRSDLPWEETVRLDLRYLEEASWALDLLIVAKTFTAVIRGQGAY